MYEKELLRIFDFGNLMGGDDRQECVLFMLLLFLYDVYIMRIGKISIYLFKFNVELLYKMVFYNMEIILRIVVGLFVFLVLFK